MGFCSSGGRVAYTQRRCVVHPLRETDCRHGGVPSDSVRRRDDAPSLNQPTVHSTLLCRSFPITKSDLSFIRDRLWPGEHYLMVRPLQQSMSHLPFLDKFVCQIHVILPGLSLVPPRSTPPHVTSPLGRQTSKRTTWRSWFGRGR